jgi:hypothetical protein
MRGKRKSYWSDGPTRGRGKQFLTQGTTFTPKKDKISTINFTELQEKWSFLTAKGQTTPSTYSFFKWRVACSQQISTFLPTSDSDSLNCFQSDQIIGRSTQLTQAINPSKH